jgi:hypothetical protein
VSTKTLVDLDSTQTLSNKTITAPTITDAAVALHASPVNTLDAATKGYVDGLNINPLNNGSLSATVSSNILTVALKTAGGAVPSAPDPVRVTFRNATDADGSLVTRTVTGATSMTFASGSTLGTTNGAAARIWVGLLDNAGTVEVCAWNPLKTASSELSIKGFTPNTDQTSTAEGSGTATNAQVLYSTNARSSVPFVLLGFIEITEASAGVWATAPTVVQTYRDGLRKTGDVVQSVFNSTGAVATGTTVVPEDDTIPQITEGDQYMTQAITPTSAINLLEIHHQGFYSHTTTNGKMLVALFQDATANALAVQSENIAGTTHGFDMQLFHLMQAGTVSATTMRIRAGMGAGATTTFNGTSGARVYGGAVSSFLKIQEMYV